MPEQVVMSANTLLILIIVFAIAFMGSRYVFKTDSVLKDTIFAMWNSALILVAMNMFLSKEQYIVVAKLTISASSVFLFIFVVLVAALLQSSFIKE